MPIEQGPIGRDASNPIGDMPGSGGIAKPPGGGSLGSGAEVRNPGIAGGATEGKYGFGFAAARGAGDNPSERPRIQASTGGEGGDVPQPPKESGLGKLWSAIRGLRGEQPPTPTEQGSSEEAKPTVPKEGDVFVADSGGQSDTDEEEKRAALRKYKKKIFFLTRAIGGGSDPATEEGRRLIRNVGQIVENREAIEEQPKISEVKSYLSSRQPLDPVEVQKHADTLKSELIKGTESLDPVDVVLGTLEGNKAITALLPPEPTKAMQERAAELEKAFLIEIVQSLDIPDLRDAYTGQIPELYTEILGRSEVTDRLIKTFGKTTQDIINDKVALAELIGNGRLQSIDGDFSGNEYGRPASKGELERLNRTAADDLESIHLLKDSGVTPFEVSGEKLRLPWDVAVVPPLADAHKDESLNVYADSAVADFLLLPLDASRSDIHFRPIEQEDGRTTKISVGDAPAVMRFRLHDNGQISYGGWYHNIPSDRTEHDFIQFGAPEAFQRLRGLFIALASDALIPEEVTTGEDVGGSVASQLPERPQHEPVGQSIIELLLRRRKALRRAGISERERTPRGWPTPESEKGNPNVRGHVTKLPQGARARSTAEQEARDYFARINVAFSGLEEGYTFTNPHYRASLAPVTFRRARFRHSTSTRAFLDSL